MREVEIERLVQWAYRDELPKRGIGNIANGWDSAACYFELLSKIDVDPGFPVIMGAPHPDALTIERAIQGLTDEVALDWRTHRELLMDDLRLLAPRGNPLLDRVFSEVALVESCARLGRRPQWNIGTPSPQRIMGKNNKPVMVGQCEGAARYKFGSHCPLQYTAPTVEQLIFRRFEYMVWRGGLERLVGILRGWLLREYMPLMPIAPAVPWLDPPAPATPDAIPIPPAFKVWA